VTEVHGQQRVDDYHWLRDKASPDVRAYLEAENAWADRILAPTQELEDQIFGEIKARIQETDISVPYRVRDWLYYSRSETGKQYSTYFRRPVSGNGEEHAFLDLNELAAGHPFLGIGSMAISPDSVSLAYSTDVTGFRQYTLHILDISTGRLHPETIELVTSVAWCSDSQTLFYVTEDESKRPCKLYRHRLGTDPADDALVYEETDQRFRVSIWRTLSGRFLFLDISSHITSDLRFIAADQPLAEFRPITPRADGHEYSVTHRGEQFLIRTNDQGSNFRLVSTDVASPEPEHWAEVLAHRPDVMLASAQTFEKFTVLSERRDGLLNLRFLTADGGDHYLQPPEPVYDLTAGNNRSFDLDMFRYSY